MSTGKGLKRYISNFIRADRHTDMNNLLSKVNGKTLRLIRLVGREADRRGIPAYVVGGIVRDIILNRKNYDMDFVIRGDAISLARALAKSLNARFTAHGSFGTVSLTLPSGNRIDLAITRKETYSHSGALPEVSPGTLDEDILRRDFTINAMAIAVNRRRFGQLIDVCGGLKDLSLKKLRILHARSFMDDPTRITRAVRFEQRLGFQIARHTLILLKECVRKKTTQNVKPQRHFNELKKILCETDPVKPLTRLHRLGWVPLLPTGTKVSFAGLKQLQTSVRKLRRDPWYNKFDQWWVINFMGLIARCSEREVNDILSSVHFTKHERQCFQQSRQIRQLGQKLTVKNLSASRIYQMLKSFTKEAIVYLRASASQRIISRRIDRFLQKDMEVRLRINGDDLKRMGMAPGHQIGKVLERVLCLKIDNKIRTRKEELNWAELCLAKS